MLIGDKQRFAVEIEVLNTVDNWVFGTFLFWLAGVIVGDPEEQTVDLKGCVNWLRDFVEVPRDRAEPELYGMDKKRAFMLLCNSVIPGIQDMQFVEDKYEDTFSRFHITHLGMTSFDNVHIVLIENDRHQQRCIWQQDEQEVLEAFFEREELQKIMSEVVSWFDEEIKDEFGRRS